MASIFFFIMLCMWVQRIVCERCKKKRSDFYINHGQLSIQPAANVPAHFCLFSRFSYLSVFWQKKKRKRKKLPKKLHWMVNSFFFFSHYCWHLMWHVFSFTPLAHVITLPVPFFFCSWPLQDLTFIFCSKNLI